MRKITIALVIVVLALLIAGCSEADKTKEAIILREQEHPTQIYSASKLSELYENKLGFLDTYGGKTIAVRGRITELREGGSPSALSGELVKNYKYWITLKGDYPPLSWIIIGVREVHKDSVYRLKEGSTVTIKGIIFATQGDRIFLIGGTVVQP